MNDWECQSINGKVSRLLTRLRYIEMERLLQRRILRQVLLNRGLGNKYGKSNATYVAAKQKPLAIFFCTVLLQTSYGSQFPTLLNQMVLAWEYKGSLLLSEQAMAGQSKKQLVWFTIPACIWLMIWRERNSRCFEEKQKSRIKLDYIILFHFW